MAYIYTISLKMCDVNEAEKINNENSKLDFAVMWLHLFTALLICPFFLSK